MTGPERTLRRNTQYFIVFLYKMKPHAAQQCTGSDLICIHTPRFSKATDSGEAFYNRLIAKYKWFKNKKLYEKGFIKLC